VTSVAPARRDDRPHQGRWLMAVFAAVLLLQLELVFHRPVNWDEFFHLSEAHAFHQGRLTEALQVFYARAFFWLPALPVDSIDQIRIARLVMFGFELFTLAAIYAMARRFTGALSAALAALAYLTGGYVFQHGFSYRADPMAAAFLMGTLWILLASRLDAKAIVGAGLLTGLAVLTTIKVVLYAPAFAGIAWLRWCEADNKRAMAMRLATFALAAVAFSGLLIGATVFSLPEAGPDSAERTVSTAGSMMFDEGFFPNRVYALKAAAMAPLLAGLLLAAPFEITGAPLSRPRRVALAALMLPVASILFFRNAFPYFYVYILPPAMVAAAVAVEPLTRRIPIKGLAFVFLANAAVVSLATPRAVLLAQRQVIAAVHDIFPRPVAYFDFPGMIVDYPKANFFMTTWGMRKYFAGIEEPFVEAMARETVPLLIVNQEPIERNQTASKPAWEFSPADARALREGFIPHWGPLWVAGRRFAAGSQPAMFEIYTPGTYTVEGVAARIDGRSYQVGETILLARGSHRFAPVTGGETRLRWGNHLKYPARPFVGGALFKDF